MTDVVIGCLEGDGIGAEVVPAAVRLTEAVTEAAGASFVWKRLPMGWEAIEQVGDPMPAETKRELATCDGWIMGPHDSASYPEEWHASGRPLPGGELRRDFDLFANVRPAVRLDGVPSMVAAMDLVVLRENTEGFYTDRNMVVGAGEIAPSPDVALAIGVFKRSSVTRVVRAGFEMARSRRGRLSVVHKANVLALTTGMYRTIAHELAPEFPDVEVDDFHADAVTVHLLRRPEHFDVIVTENMLGDILSDLAGELAGGLGIAPGLNAGPTHAMAQAVHGGAPDIAGRGIANPTAEMLSAMMLLRWTGSGNESPLPVYGPTGVEAVVGGFNAAYAADNGYRTAHHGPVITPPAAAGATAMPFAVPTGPVMVYEADGLKVTAFPVDHRPVQPAVGYRFDYKGRSVVISGDTAKSPMVERVAKGADLLAFKIRSIGREHGVAIVENPPLARQLYADVEVGQEVPVQMFALVAEVLAYVWRTSRRKQFAWV